MDEYNSITEHPLGADTHLIIEPPVIINNTSSISYKSTKWKLEVFTSPSKKAILEYDGSNEYTSSGVLQTFGKVNDNNTIDLYIKSSEVEWGKGELKGQMSIYVDNSNFKGGKQVIKTYLSDLGITIV